MSVLAQQAGITVSGHVKDSTGQPVSNAMITLVRMQDQAGIYFTTSDSKGFFKIEATEVFQPNYYFLKAAAAGFVKQEIPLQKNMQEYLFSMQTMIDAHTLPGVTVSSKSLVVQKGDTLSYSAEMLTEKSDRRLGDIIKKLPGVEVDDNGIIKYQGKTINQFYIEGDNLLGDKYNIATDNINVADIDKVQVIEHNQHVKMLNGIIPSDKAAINITLKNKSKLKFLNNAEVALALPKTYSIEGKSMAFKPNFKSINEIKLNDMGAMYSRETGISGLQAPTGISASRALYNNSKMLNINDLYKFNPATGLKLNGFYIKDWQQSINNIYTKYLLPNADSIVYRELNNNQLFTNALNLELSLDINSTKTFFNTTTSFTRNEVRRSAAITNNNHLLQNGMNTATSFNNATGGYFLVKKKHVLNYSNNFSYQKNPAQLILTPGVLENTINDSIPYLLTNQQQGLNTYSNLTRLSYSKVINNWTAGLNTGLNIQRQQLQSGVTLLQNDSTKTSPHGFANAINWNKTEWFAAAALTYNGYRSRLLMNFPVKWQHYNYNNDSVLTNKEAGKRFTVEPTINWEYRIGRENTVNFGYSLNYQTAGIQQIYGGAIISGYRSFASYETPFLMNRNHTVTAGFSYKRVIKAIFSNIDLSYATVKNFFLYSTTIQQNITGIKAIPVINYGKTGGVSARASKYIFPLNTTVAINGTFNIAQSQQLQNELLFNTNTILKNAGITITPTILKWLKLDLSSYYTQYRTTSAQTTFQSQIVHQWKQQSGITVYPFKAFSINISNSYYQSVQKLNPTTSSLFIDSYAQYKFDKRKLLLRLNCTNIANMKNFEIINVNNNITSTASYNLRPRTVSLMASYDF